ncbi:probable phosphorylase b kinase regulatory subunit beta [Glossina fuscipes]|uniref:Phosphorylase b kinase regulatory subunit n=1 Tax=Glossina fuscipes TaxID=7396 RepID=A0A9C5ZF43_9MUSC|nr:probable phosphorylase b kinase regulatory subunit beta [Glossina fuscipes]
MGKKKTKAVMSTDQEVGSVRGSVYCAAAVWSLYQAYRRTDDDRGKSYELGQSTVKCMRGILQCWIKQACRVEFFKQRQSNQYGLHSKFHLHTGEDYFLNLFLQPFANRYDLFVYNFFSSNDYIGFANYLYAG